MRGTAWGLPDAVDGGAGGDGIHAVQRGGELVEVALAPLLAIGDDVDVGGLHVGHREADGVVLGRLQERLGDPPHLAHAHARHRVGSQPLVIHQPARLGIAPHHRGGEHLGARDEGRHDLLGEPGELLHHDRLGRAHAIADVDVLEAGELLLERLEVGRQLLRRPANQAPTLV
jgi:hypothetical protein